MLCEDKMGILLIKIIKKILPVIFVLFPADAKALILWCLSIKKGNSAEGMVEL